MKIFILGAGHMGSWFANILKDEHEVAVYDTDSTKLAKLEGLPKECIISDIASVKAGLAEFYERAGRPFVSTHPMFGPTFATIDNLAGENAVIIEESDERGKEFFRKFYGALKLNIFDYTFKEHDETVAYSLATPFASTITFAACMKDQEAPGTTFKKHKEIAKGLLSEDDYLLTEILFSPGALDQIEKISQQLAYLTHIIRGRDYDVMKKFLNGLRDNIK
jgi:prephenate dehydrogenase